MMNIAIIGGGVAGLTAALLLARDGKTVTVYEQANTLGGRARTREIEGFQFNMGAHAVYRKGIAARTMKELEIALAGDIPPINYHSKIRINNKIEMLPASPRALLQSAALSPTQKLNWLTGLVKVMRADAEAARTVRWESWLQAHISSARVREIILALSRLATYTNHPDLSAWAALTQLQMTLNGSVLYLDGGWMQWVEKLSGAVQEAGGTVICGKRVQNVEMVEGSPQLYFADGEVVSADKLLLTTPPNITRNLLPQLPDFPSMQPVRAACLNLGLRQLPNPQCSFATSTDAPLYYSVHTRAAKLTYSGGEVVHLMKYLGEGESSDNALAELETFMEQLQPNWRQHEVTRQYLPTMTVMHTAPLAEVRRQTVQTSLPTVFLAGDWVGDEGILADTAVASARRAAELM